ncbi:3-hydroxybutyryl-CoA dehydrogenase [Alicyclobacillus acidoterrestris]|uniref:3-hydroxyacyl-CoA dehydrogenase NAD-binding domain-containing protein n=1 Tax=Alicyclobacillus suci TaxID=2816080 RepID=UPI001190FE7A|nr:3-hydroxyacyl-CoA dehydrogenase NAD-binding domain-containing protein [Alicyclobacillus suci]GEO25923.1 3-hydroxybutyryl-CoA dehydrogenase [Alicyclobacillus acidoterrestris]
MHKGTVTVVGAGTMGNGIAEVFAVGGYSVKLFDVNEEAREHGIHAILLRLQKQFERGKLDAKPQEIMCRIQGISTLAQSEGSALVVEAALERLDVKQDIFRSLDNIHSPTTILATNTSSMSVTEIASVTSHPERVIGMHFFNPAPRMPLVEIVRSRMSSDDAISTAMGLANDVGKVPIQVRDTPGFIVNRVARPFYNEALRLVGDRVATVEQVDRIMRSAGFKMGPFELQDMIGLDINFAATRSTYESFFGEPRFRPHPIQRTMVNSGMLGRKTGRGYYRYDE